MYTVALLAAFFGRGCSRSNRAVNDILGREDVGTPRNSLRGLYSSNFETLVSATEWNERGGVIQRKKRCLHAALVTVQLTDDLSSLQNIRIANYTLG